MYIFQLFRIRLGDKKVYKPKSKAVKEMYTYGKGAPGKN